MPKRQSSGLACIKNLGLENLFIFNSALTIKAGGLFGAAEGSPAILNCYTTGKIINMGYDINNTYIGGLGGYVSGRSLEFVDCFSKVDIKSVSKNLHFLGGVVG